MNKYQISIAKTDTKVFRELFMLIYGRRDLTDCSHRMLFRETIFVTSVRVSRPVKLVKRQFSAEYELLELALTYERFSRYDGFCWIATQYLLISNSSTLSESCSIIMH